MHEHSHTTFHRTSNRELAGAEQRHVTEADAARGRGRKRAREVVGRREDDRHDVVVIDVIAIDHLFAIGATP